MLLQSKAIWLARDGGDGIVVRAAAVDHVSGYDAGVWPLASK
jgi:hypothetical protein